jgi:hypothetical protein
MLPELGHELMGRGWKGAGESMEATDIVSSSGVAGSRYGFVVLMKVTCLGMSSQTVSSSNVFL